MFAAHPLHRSSATPVSKIPGLQTFSYFSVRRKDVIAFIRNLGVLVDARIPIADALASLVPAAPKSRLDIAVAQLHSDVVGGTSLADAVARHPEIFPAHFAELIRVGEATGELNTILLRLAAQAEKSLQLRRQIRAALSYPILVLVVTISSTAFLLTSIVPKFADLYTGFGASLPAPTALVINLSGFLRDTWFGWIFLAVILVVGANFAYRNHTGRILIHRLLLTLPLMGKLTRESLVGNYSQTLAMLLESGVTADRAVRLSVGCTPNAYFQECMKHVTSQIRNGVPLTSATSDAQLFPRFAIEMLSAGEKAGELPLALNHIGSYYAAQVENTSAAMASLVEPVLIILVGTLLGGLLAALYLPLFDIVNVIA